MANFTKTRPHKVSNKNGEKFDDVHVLAPRTLNDFKAMEADGWSWVSMGEYFERGLAVRMQAQARGSRKQIPAHVRNEIYASMPKQQKLEFIEQDGGFTKLENAIRDIYNAKYANSNK